MLGTFGRDSVNSNINGVVKRNTIDSDRREFKEYEWGNHDEMKY